jgi:sarcosine oxidase subunit gamma
MLDRRSALATAQPYRISLMQMGELRGFSLLQVSGFGKPFEKALSSAVGKLPKDVGKVQEHAGRLVMRIGPEQFWIVGPEEDDLVQNLGESVLVTPLSHSRTRIILEGPPARDVLAKGIPLDFHPSAFKPGMFAMTGLHHTPVLVHCVSEDRFELYAMRTFAMSVWEWLADAALEFADR